MKNAMVKNGVGMVGYVYQPKTNYKGTGIKWYQEETKKSSSKKK